MNWVLLIEFQETFGLDTWLIVFSLTIAARKSGLSAGCLQPSPPLINLKGSCSSLKQFAWKEKPEWLPSHIRNSWKNVDVPSTFGSWKRLILELLHLGCASESFAPKHFQKAHRDLSPPSPSGLPTRPASNLLAPIGVPAAACTHKEEAVSCRELVSYQTSR